MAIVLFNDKITKEIVEKNYEKWLSIVNTMVQKHPSLTHEEAFIIVMTYSDPTYTSQLPAEAQILQTDPYSSIGMYYRKMIKVLGRKHTTLTMADWFAIMKYNYKIGETTRA